MIARPSARPLQADREERLPQRRPGFSLAEGWVAMKKTLVLACALILVGGVRARAADTNSFDPLVKDQLDLYKEATNTLKTIKDKDTAKAAMPKLTKLHERMVNLGERFRKLGRPTDEQRASLDKKFKSSLMAAHKDFRAEYDRVMKVPGGMDALRALEGRDLEKAPPQGKDQKDK
jgi:hypothetical protein